MNDDELLSVTETAGGSEPPAQVQTPATPTAPPDVNALVEHGVQSYLATNLPTLVEREVQSRLARQSNKAKKQFQEDKRAIERMAQRQGWDAAEMQKQLDSAISAANYVDYGDEEAPAAVVSPPPQPTLTNQPQTARGAVTADEERAGIENHIKSVYLFDPKEMGFDITPYLGIRDPNDPKLAQFRQQALDYAAQAKEQQAQARRVGETYQGLGNPLVLSRGTSPPPANPYANVTDRATLADLAGEEEWNAIRR